MNVAVIGSGGREHALGYKLAESKSVNKLFFIPGNGGTANLGENLNLSPDDFDGILSFAREKNINLVVIGPEQPLVNGLTDFLEINGIHVFGPSKNAAVIEGEKSFAKNFMKEFAIPTAAFRVFTNYEKEECLTYLDKISYPVIIKADGLAAGKGVIICDNYDIAEKTIYDFFDNKRFGSAGKKVVIEEFLEGPEVSVFAVTDGVNYLLLPPSQDHKRIYDNDNGPNTGGMGAYAPASFVTDEMLRRIDNEIIFPTISSMKKIGRKFKGVLFFGLMITKDGPKVIEYNCRFGDPETQAILPLIEGDFARLLHSAALGKLDKTLVSFRNGKFSVTVVAASEGYPNAYEKGKEIFGLDLMLPDNIYLFHAGTKVNADGKIITNGGRVLAVTAVSDSLKSAKTEAYKYLAKINFDGIYYRKDIADKGLKNS